MEEQGKGATLGAAAVLAAVVGVAAGAGARVAKNLGLSHEAEEARLKAEAAKAEAEKPAERV